MVAVVEVVVVVVVVVVESRMKWRSALDAGARVTKAEGGDGRGRRNAGTAEGV